MSNDLDSRLTPGQRFGRELMRARKAHGLSQLALGGHLLASQSLIGRIELGTRRPREDFATRCDEFFGTRDLFIRLCRNIGAPTGPRWYIQWTDEIEPYASILRSWDPLLVPGLLQTEDYARAIFRGGLAGRSRQAVEDGVTARMRRKLILETDNPPDLHVLMDEWVIRRTIGDPQVMEVQLSHLLELATRPNVTMQLVPFDTPCTTGLMSAFTIAELPDLPTTVSVDSAAEATVSADHEFVTMMWTMYDKIRIEAYRPSESTRMIKEARDQWKQTT